MTVMWHHNAAARMTDVYYCINPSVMDELYLTNLDGKRGRAAFKKEVNDSGDEVHGCGCCPQTSSFRVGIVAWYQPPWPDDRPL